VRYEDLKYLGISFAVMFVIFSAAFHKSGMFLALKLTLGLYWLFILPGFFLLLAYEKKLSFFERLVAGTVIGAVLMTVFGYYIGIIFALNIKYYPWFLPPIFIIAGYYLSKK
jgi:hypothetical protein